jgi:hypothetical protein
MNEAEEPGVDETDEARMDGFAIPIDPDGWECHEVSTKAPCPTLGFYQARGEEAMLTKYSALL